MNNEPPNGVVGGYGPSNVTGPANTQSPFLPPTGSKKIPGSNLVKPIGIGVAALAVAAALVGGIFLGIHAFIGSKNDGTLQVITIAGAQVSVQPVGGGLQKIGIGTLQKKLVPGEYQVTASTSKAATSATITVDKQKITSVKLQLQQMVPEQQIVSYSAQDIYEGTNKNLYFVNVPQTELYIYPLGNSSARQYLTARASNVNQTAWISPTQFFVNSGNSWNYVNGNTSTVVQYNGQNPTSGSMSFGVKGAYAFVTPSKDVVFSANPTTAPQSIGKASTNNAHTAVAPNGDVLVFGATTTGGSNTSEPPKLYQTKGQGPSLPASITSVTNVAWAPDSSKFSFATTGGMYIYDLTKQTVTPVLLEPPSDPTAMYWINTTTLIYANNGTVWRYQTDASVLASVAAANVTGLLYSTDDPFSLAPDGQTVYFSTKPDSQGHGGAIYSIIPNYASLSKSEQQTLLAANQAAAAQTTPNYSGDDGLSDYIQPDQLTTLYYDFGQYFATNHLSVDTITISNIQQQCQVINNFSTQQVCTNTVNFSVSATGRNANSYNARIDYSGSSSIRLRLYDIQTNKLLYDSGMTNSATS